MNYWVFMEQAQMNEENKNQTATVILRLLITLTLLFIFLVGVKSLSTGLKMMGTDFMQHSI